MDATYITVIDAETLAGHLDDPRWVIVDCRFDLFAPEAGERRYGESHIPGAVYAHLDRDLSGPLDPTGRGGRHPLPTPAALARLLARLGITASSQVVAYDDQSGHYAARLWWMLRAMGHAAVAVLDGGWAGWVAEGRPTSGVLSADDGRQTTDDRLNPDPLTNDLLNTDLLITSDDVPAAPLLVDARAPERYRGEVEPLDPVAGHIPGAVNRPYTDNWDAAGRWRSPEALLAEFQELLGPTRPEEAVFYCGSGVSACVNLLAMSHAGLPMGRLYAGSWSEWSRLGHTAG